MSREVLITPSGRWIPRLSLRWHFTGWEDETPVQLFLTNGQKKGEVSGREIFSEVGEHPPLGGNILDHLLENQARIPIHWQKVGRGGAILFWGTAYREVSPPVQLPDSYNVWIPALMWYGDIWRRSAFPIYGEFGQAFPSALAASSRV